MKTQFYREGMYMDRQTSTNNQKCTCTNNFTGQECTWTDKPVQTIRNVHRQTILQGRNVHGQTDHYKGSGMYMDRQFHTEGIYRADHYKGS